MKLFLGISIIIGIFMHSFIAMYIDKLRLLYKKARTNWALVPFVNMYLLGKYAVDIILGVILFLLLAVVVNYSVTFFDITYSISLFTNKIRTVLFVVYFIGTICLLFYASGKYNKATNYKDRFDFDDIVYYIKETLWIVLFFIAIYFFALFIVGLGTGAIII